MRRWRISRIRSVRLRAKAAIGKLSDEKPTSKPASTSSSRRVRGLPSGQGVPDYNPLLMHAIVHAADVHDRDGGAPLMASLFGAFPFRIKLYADGDWYAECVP
jgi:hypothetical protein